ncbi:response regulator [Niastella populi]|uniref:DNA-binding response regulator n=1 Tax=Niastella populi TaxID=550983 RepID=A0A1V9GCT1_9BACT|nr:response regulator transcription factor [Niastella populi]OQP68423.1 DNA-binding response regulator [Niastella populi]
MTIKIAITDDHPIVANGLKKILDDFANIDVVAVYTTGNDMLKEVGASLPDVMLLDMNLPDLEGPDLARQLLKKFPSIKIIVLTSSDVTVQVKKMLQIGCQGYLLKDSDDKTIVQAIETVYGGGQFLSPVIQQQLVNDMFRTKNQKQNTLLTRREKEVLQLITQEYTNQEIADKLFISLHTVDNHRSSLLQKLDAKNTAGLVKKAIENGLVE